jgi:zinc transport system ATP-binding protein
VGYVPQNTNLNIDFPITALEIVLMGIINSKKRIFGYSKEDIEKAFKEESVKGGSLFYYNKYLKYKSKYLQIKNKYL